jgi:hypothetical protein
MAKVASFSGASKGNIYAKLANIWVAFRQSRAKPLSRKNTYPRQSSLAKFY